MSGTPKSIGLFAILVFASIASTRCFVGSSNAAFPQVTASHGDMQFWRRVLVSTNAGQDLQHENESLSLSDWEKGIKFEVNFWRRVLRTKGGRRYRKWYRDATRVRASTPFAHCYAVTHQRKPWRVLDVGSGPITFLGPSCGSKGSVEVTAMDALAPQYNELLGEVGLLPYFRTQYGMVEDLDTYFSPNSFAFVHMANSLDHCQNPLEGIRRLLRVVRPGGTLYLIHGANEADKQNYAGFHQWNFDAVGASFIISNKLVSMNATDEVGDLADVFTTVEIKPDSDSFKPRRYIVVKCIKKGHLF